MKSMHIRVAIVSVVLSLATASTAAAQWSVGSYGVAEYDTKQTLLLLAGINANPSAKGWQPLLNLQAYNLSFDAGADRTNVFAVTPAVGLIDNLDDGDLYGTIGYQFSNDENGGPVSGTTRGEGVELSGGSESWGAGGGLAHQILASYNFGSESFWGRARLTGRVSQSGASSTRLGAEAAYLSGPGYHAVQPGIVWEWHSPSNQVLGLGAGGKFMSPGGSAAYFRVEGFIPLAH
jgi:hypothetical protein